MKYLIGLLICTLSMPLQAKAKCAGKFLNPMLQLMREHPIPFYFDQAGRLSRYFGLEQVPARVSQHKDKLLIEELKL